MEGMLNGHFGEEGFPVQRHIRSTSNGPVKKRINRKALLTIVDLAGSEKLSKTGTDKMLRE